jgi:hypothetical protein
MGSDLVRPAGLRAVKLIGRLASSGAIARWRSPVALLPGYDKAPNTKPKPNKTLKTRIGIEVERISNKQDQSHE